MKNVTLLLTAFLCAAWGTGSALAGEDSTTALHCLRNKQASAAEMRYAEAAKEPSNTVCPVSGDKIDKKTQATCEYEGTTYAFCCLKCVEEFKKDPARYIDEIKAQRRIDERRDR